MALEMNSLAASVCICRGQPSLKTIPCSMHFCVTAAVLCIHANSLASDVARSIAPSRLQYPLLLFASYSIKVTSPAGSGGTEYFCPEVFMCFYSLCLQQLAGCTVADNSSNVLLHSRPAPVFS